MSLQKIYRGKNRGFLAFCSTIGILSSGNRPISQCQRIRLAWMGLVEQSASFLLKKAVLLPLMFVMVLSVVTQQANAQSSQIIVDNVTAQTGTTSSRTISFAVGGGPLRFLIVGISIRDVTTATVSSVTYGGNSLTFTAGVTNSSNNARAEIWRMLNPPSGTADVVVTFSAAVDAVVGVVSFYGVRQSDPIGTAGTATGDSTSPSVTVSSETNGIVIDTLSTQGNAGTTSQGGGQTSRWNASTGAGGPDSRGAGSTELGAASVTMSWTLANARNWALVALPIKPNNDPTAVLVNSFTARVTRNQVRIAWETANEFDLVGFNLLRSTSPIGPYAQINPTLIAAQASGSLTGASYRYFDGNVISGTAYYYVLELVNLDGSSQHVGPVIVQFRGLRISDLIDVQ